ncbi:cell division protein FtsQ [Evansella vedderi]|uniref:Cell division protein DivIB n=1 Tax=Evansella vedderi TaxID=38282 RepID=A0ABT9ZRF2_9BACI|nr:FtsQ-type POTRA domain-containing protein [Evansella vedderi]MDQ0253814.1 cell division protein FtsQ [Evansella vedderi]
MSQKKIIEIEERIPTLKERRRQRTNRRLIIYISVFFLLMTVVAYFQSSFSHIKHVEVHGNNNVTESWVIENSGLFPDVSMWLYRGEDVQATLLEHPEVADVTVTRQWPNTISITIEEYQRIAYIEEEGRYIPLLSNGYTLKEADNTFVPYDAPILVGFYDSDVKAEIAKELMEVSSSLRLRMSEIYLSPVDNDHQRLTIYMNDGFIVSSTVRRFAERIAPYPSVVEQLDPSVEGIVHMRMNPYFERFESEEEEAGESEG